MSSIGSYTISPFINNRSVLSACGQGCVDSLEQFQVANFTSGATGTIGLSIQATLTPPLITANPIDIKTMQLWVDNLRTENCDFSITTPNLTLEATTGELSLTSETLIDINNGGSLGSTINIETDVDLTLSSNTGSIILDSNTALNGTLTLDALLGTSNILTSSSSIVADTSSNLKNTSITPYQIEVRDEINGPLGDPVIIQISPGQIYMEAQNNTQETLTLTVPLINMTNTNTGFINDIAPDSITIQDTVANNTLSLTPTTLTTNNGLTVNGLTTFSTCPQTPIVPTVPDDLVNLNYLQNNPPASAVIFYLNNSLTPTPAISSYALLGVTEDILPQSSINTSISGVATIQLIQSFANQLINLNAGSFIPAGIWDMSIFSQAVLSGDIGHISLYFKLFGRTSEGVETQIGTDSSSVTVSTTTISQIIMTLVLPYTPLAGYESLVVKLYGINDRSPQTDITTYYEGTQSYSHMHTTFGVYVPPSLLGTNNVWTGVNTFSQTIVGSISGNADTATTATTSSNVALTSDNTSGTYFLPFSKSTSATTNALYIDDTVSPLSYNPGTATLTATNFAGTASSSLTTTAIALTSDNTAGTYFIPFSKSTSAGANTLYIDPTVSPLTYNPSGGNLNVLSISPNVIQTTIQILASGSTINYLLGAIVVDIGAVASAYTLPVIATINNGIEITIQKTSATNHNCVITSGAGNQIASIAANALSNTFTMSNTIYRQSFRAINSNWFPF